MYQVCALWKVLLTLLNTSNTHIWLSFLCTCWERWGGSPGPPPSGPPSGPPPGLQGGEDERCWSPSAPQSTSWNAPRLLLASSSPTEDQPENIRYTSGPIGTPGSVPRPTGELSNRRWKKKNAAFIQSQPMGAQGRRPALNRVHLGPEVDPDPESPAARLMLF